MNLDASLTTAEGVGEGLVAPGQEDQLQQFIDEQRQQEEQERLLGKFKSTEDLAKAYTELEKKLGQRASEAPAEDLASPSDDDAEDAEAEDAGDTEGAYELTPDEVGEIMALAGGEDAYKELGGWARKNLEDGLVQDFNKVVAQGNVDAIKWAVRAMVAQQSKPAAEDILVEPKLVAGGAPSSALSFESQAQVLDAMNKKNSKGQRLYDVDDSYRAKVRDALARSDVF